MTRITRYGVVRNGRYWTVWYYLGDEYRREGLSGCDRYTPKKQVRELAALHVQQAELRADNPKGDSLAAWLAAYRAMRQHEIAESTIFNIDRVGALLTAYFGDSKLIGTITRAEAAAWRASLQRPRKLKDGSETTLSPSTVAKHVMWAKQVFRAAVDIDQIASNPFDRLPSGQPRVDQHWEYVKMADVARILDACPTPQWRAAFALARYAGLRRNEIHSLRWADIDLTARTLTVHSATRVRTTKARRRVCPVSPELASVLEAVKAAMPGTAGPWDGQVTHKHTADARAIVVAAGVAPYAKPFHTLRKSLETDWIDAHEIADVCEWLGNSPAVALAHYKRAKPEALARVSGVLAQGLHTRLA